MEDVSGKRALEVLIPKIIGAGQSFRIHARGIGRIPKRKRILLNNLPYLLSGYGQTYFQTGFPDAVFVICDLDDRNRADFLAELNYGHGYGLPANRQVSSRGRADAIDYQYRFIVAIRDIRHQEN